MSDAEIACEYIAARVRAVAGARWLQGAMCPALTTAVTTPGVRLFAEHRLWRIERAVASGLVAWAAGERNVDLLYAVPTSREVLALQARGRRCVSLLDEGVPTAPHADGLAFALHDLCHLEKFVDPEHHTAQVGFFASLDRAVHAPGWADLERPYDDAWASDFAHVAADMNGSPIFLFSALKMKLKMAARRALARELGRPAPTGGPLDDGEARAFAEALEALLDLLDIRGELRTAARAVNTKRDAPDPAVAIQRHFTEVGRRPLSGAS